tara:strand:+ start:290 stop:565 length:276 start_codon:yes stop_codon:yes gene_type:complete
MNLLLKAMNQAKVEETTEEVDEPIAINYEINEKVVAKITKQVDSVSLTLPELAEDCTHHFVIPTRGVTSIGMCRVCGGGRLFNNIPSQEGA